MPVRMRICVINVVARGEFRLEVDCRMNLVGLVVLFVCIFGGSEVNSSSAIPLPILRRRLSAYPKPVTPQSYSVSLPDSCWTVSARSDSLLSAGPLPASLLGRQVGVGQPLVSPLPAGQPPASQPFAASRTAASPQLTRAIHLSASTYSCLLASPKLASIMSSDHPFPESPSPDSSLLDSPFSPIVVEDEEEPPKIVDVPGSPVKLVQSSCFR